LSCLAAAACATVGVATAATNAAASQAPDNWTQWAFNAQHTGFNPHVTGLGRFAAARLNQVFATRLVTQPDPIVVNGKVYLSGSAPAFAVQAIDAATGAKLWTRTGCIQETPTDPAFAGGSVWVALDDPGFAAVSADGTRIKCIGTTGGFDYTSPPSAARGTVYAGSDGGVVTAVDAVTGHVRWSKDVAPGHSLDSPTVSPDGRFLFVVGDNGFIYKVNATTGQVLWSRFIDTCAGTAASVTATRVYVGGCNLYALSPSTGHLVWHTSRFGPGVTTPTIVGDKVIATAAATFGNSTGAAAFDAATGRRLWFDHGSGATVPLTAADGVVYFNGGYFIAMLNSSNGASISDLFSPDGSTFVGSVVPAEGRVYVCTQSTTGVFTLRAYKPKP
jgi:outer membrane protein assembly factor BamB